MSGTGRGGPPSFLPVMPAWRIATSGKQSNDVPNTLDDLNELRELGDLRDKLDKRDKRIEARRTKAKNGWNPP